MTKNIPVQHDVEEEEFDFFNDMDTPDTDAMIGMMTTMIDAGKHEMTIAMDLTALISDNHAPDHMTEEQIMATFKRTLATVVEHSPMKAMWEKFNSVEE